MELFVVSTPIGNLGDITFRAIETLKSVDAILVEDTRTSMKLLNHFEIKKPLIQYHKFNESEVCENATSLFSKYEKIALISDAGTPAICDPGSKMINQARELGAKITPIIGANAVITAVSLSGDEEPKFSFVGFFPRQTSEQKQLIEQMKNSFIKHFVFYESPKRIVKTLKLFDNETVKQLRVFNDLTKQFEREYIGSLYEVISMLEYNENVELGEYVVSITFKKVEKAKEETLSFESLLIQEMVSKKISAKTAIDNLSQKGIAKNALKKAKLNIKEIIENVEA